MTGRAHCQRQVAFFYVKATNLYDSTTLPFEVVLFRLTVKSVEFSHSMHGPDHHSSLYIIVVQGSQNE